MGSIPYSLHIYMVISSPPGASAPTFFRHLTITCAGVHYYHHEVMWIACVCARCEKYVPHVPRSKHLVEHLCGTQFIPQHVRHSTGYWHECSNVPSKTELA